MMNPEPLSLDGEFQAFATPDGCEAEVRAGGLVKQTFSGETAWSDAVRAAEDRNFTASRR